jgi:hypothetical protein
MKNIRITEAGFDDKSAVVELLKRNNLIGDDDAIDWVWLWLRNPAYSKNWPLGWKLEMNGEIVGFIGNIPLRYSLGGKVIRAVAAHCFVVDQKARGYGIKLAAQFFSQDQVDVFLCTTTNRSASVIFKLFKSQPLPCSSYSRYCFWVINSRRLIRSYLLKKYRIPRVFADFFSFVMGPMLSLGLFLRKHGNYADSNSWEGRVEIISALKFGDEFDRFWLQKKNCDLSKTLLADRSSRLLKWHFGKNHEVANSSRVLVARYNGELLGYIVLIRQDLPKIRLKQYQIADIFVANDEPKIIISLLIEALEIAKRDKVDFVKMIGFPDKIRNSISATFPLERDFLIMPFWFYTNDPEFKVVLNKVSSWYAGPYDGDTTL